MKQDPYFKYLAAVILLGVFLALADTGTHDNHPGSVTTVTVSSPAPMAHKS